MENPSLIVRHLNVNLKVNDCIYPIVRDLSFELKAGKTLALVGESGCGKSMTAQALLSILPQPPTLPPEGEVIFKGQNLLKLKNKEMRKLRGKSIAMIFQDPLSALNPVYTIGTQLMEVAETHLKLEGSLAEEAALRALEEVALPRPKEILKRYPHELSGGMLQRAVIGMALIASPEVLIADEPTTALDVSIQSQILHLLEELKTKRGMAILLITHDMGIVARHADEVMVMYAGEGIEMGSAQDVLQNPLHPYTKALLAARPQKKMRKLKLATIPGFVPRLTEELSGCRFHPRCQYTMEKCKQEAPQQLPSSYNGSHQGRCWLNA